MFRHRQILKPKPEREIVALVPAAPFGFRSVWRFKLRISTEIRPTATFFHYSHFVIVPVVRDSLDLNLLSDGIAPGLSSHMGGVLAEAAAVCLEKNEHRQGVTLAVIGDKNDSVSLEWTATTNQTRNTHYDLQDATEDGACGIAIALLRHLDSKLVLRRTWKGKGEDRGHDYWLGSPENENLPPFQKNTRLEVSGILNGDDNELKKRLREKYKQVQTSTSSVPGLAVVVMFNIPKAGVRKYEGN